MTIARILKKNWLLILIILAGAFLRIYNFTGFMWWGIDSGRDILVAKHIILYQELVFAGPFNSTQINGFGLISAPHYYYFLALLYFFLRNPVLIAGFFAIAGIFTIFLSYLTGKEIFNQKTGIICALMVSLSPTLIKFSRNVWQPNILPLGIFLFLLFAFKAIYKDNVWFFLAGVTIFCFFFFIHWSMFLLLPFFLIWFFYSLGKFYKSFKKDIVLVFLIAILIGWVISIVVFYEYGNIFENINFLIQNRSGPNLGGSLSNFINTKALPFLVNTFTTFFISWENFPGETFILNISVILLTVVWFVLSFFSNLGKKLEYKFINLGFIFAAVIFIWFSWYQTKGILSGQMQWYYLTPLVILWFLMFSYVLAKVPGKIFFVFLLLSSFYFSFLSLATFYSNKENGKFEYSQTDQITNDILSIKKSDNFLVFGADWTHGYNYGLFEGPQYWFDLEEKLQKKLINVDREGGLHINEVVINQHSPEKLFFVCRVEVEKEIDQFCPQSKVKTFIKKTYEAKNMTVSQIIKRKNYIISVLE